MRRFLLAAVCVIAVSTVAHAQAPVIEWLFDEDTSEWGSADPNAQLTSTADANVVREEDNGVLELNYTPAVGTLSAIVGPVAGGAAGAKSVHGWVKSSEQALLLIGMTEADGSQYISAFCSLPGSWQEFALDLSEFSLGDDSTDENGKLDPDQVQALMMADGVSFLATAAETIPFIMGPDLTPRLLWVDDLSIETNGVEPRWVVSEENGVKTVQIDSFESTPLQWMALAGKGVELAYDSDLKFDGEFAMRFAYDLPQGKIFAAITSLKGPDLTGMTALHMAMLSEVSTTLLVEIQEVDGSKYNATLELTAGEELEVTELPLSEFTLGDDSEDENGKLDIAQAKQLMVGDISAIAGAPTTINTLWLDDVTFTQ